jgi:hypothetical protein
MSTSTSESEGLVDEDSPGPRERVGVSERTPRSPLAAPLGHSGLRALTPVTENTAFIVRGLRISLVEIDSEKSYVN